VLVWATTVKNVVVVPYFTYTTIYTARAQFETSSFAHIISPRCAVSSPLSSACTSACARGALMRTLEFVACGTSIGALRATPHYKAPCVYQSARAALSNMLYHAKDRPLPLSSPFSSCCKVWPPAGARFAVHSARIFGHMEFLGIFQEKQAVLSFQTFQFSIQNIQTLVLFFEIRGD